jgi:hypothetical protein
VSIADVGAVAARSRAEDRKAQAVAKERQAQSRSQGSRPA